MGNPENGPNEQADEQKETKKGMTAKEFIEKWGGLDSWLLWGGTEHCRPIEEVMEEKAFEKFEKREMFGSTMKPSEEAKAEEDIRDGRWVPGVLRGWPKRDSESAGIFDDVDDPDPPPEPVEKMREKLGKKKLLPVDRKAKVEETRNAVAEDLFIDLDDAPPETMEELKKKPVPKDEDVPDWAKKPEKMTRRGKKEEPEEESDK